jgi:hypothetical protein
MRIAADLRSAGSNPTLSGPGPKSLDSTFVDENGVEYPYGLNPNPAGPFSALAVYRITGSDPSRAWRSGPSEDELYELRALDPDGRADDLVRQDRWMEGAVTVSSSTVILRNLSYLELTYFTSMDETVELAKVRVSPEGKSVTPPAPIPHDAIRAVRLAIAYPDPGTGKIRKHEAAVRKMIRVPPNAIPTLLSAATGPLTDTAAELE